MNILGIAFLSDASAAVLKDGKLVSAVSEERLNRVKLWNGIPKLAIQQALDLAGLTLDDIDLIATHGQAPSEPDPKPFQEKEKMILASTLSPEQKQVQVESLRKRLEHERMVLGTRTPAYLAEIRALNKPVYIVGHHEAHAATAFYGSGWNDCMVLTADGWGEDGSSTLWRGKGRTFERLSRSNTFDSLGYFYGSITKALGFVPHRHEGKILGLAAYCKQPKSYGSIRSMIDYDARSKSFVGRMDRGMYLPRFENPALKEFVKNYSREDVSSSAQQSLEEVVCAFIKDLGTSPTRLAVAGGLFANVKLNQRIIGLPNIKEIFVFPNMGDGGLSVGAAWLAYVNKTGHSPEPLKTLYLGAEPTDKEIAKLLSGSGLTHKHFPDIEERIGELLSQGEVVACCQGRMEFGPRALGNRSILCEATDPSINDSLNQRLSRSEFMPFAPATLAEKAEEYYVDFEGGREAARYMTITFACTPKMIKEAPAAVHVDGTARPQLVSKDDNPRFHKILSSYHRRTGRASVINTSFNMHEEPIVGTADDAVRAFRAGQLPYLAVGNFLVQAEEDTLK